MTGKELPCYAWWFLIVWCSYNFRALLIRNLSHIWEADKFSHLPLFRVFNAIIIYAIFLTLVATCGTYLLVFCKLTSSVTGWLQVRPMVWFKLNQQHFQTTLLATCRIFSECLVNQLSMWWLDFSCDEWSESSRIELSSQHFETFVETCGIYCKWTSIDFN